MDPTESIRLGAQGPEVTRLGLGASALGGLFEPVPPSAGLEVVRSALSLGLRQVDTAPLYGLGQSEIVCGRGVVEVPRSSVVVSTKVGRLLRTGASQPEQLPAGMWHGRTGVDSVVDFSADAITRSLEESLERLGLEYVDVAFVHDPDEHMDAALAEAFPTLRRLQEQGLVGAVGAGMTDSTHLTRIVVEAEPDCILLAGRYSLLDQDAALELLPACRERGVGVVVGGVFNSGVLADPVAGARFDYAPASPVVLERARRLSDVCAAHGVSLAAAALRFPLEHEAVQSVLVGVRSTAELHRNIAAFSASIPGDLWLELAELELIDGRGMRGAAEWAHRAPRSDARPTLAKKRTRA